jgi:drug/metabolite transporter (DMT)-like permease
MGVLWGLAFSLARLAVENGGTALGMAFWQTALSSTILIGFTSLRGRYFVPRRRHLGHFAILALLGVTIPGVCYFLAASRVPSGVLAITVTLVPIFTYCFAVSLRLEAFALIRVGGVICGTIAIIMLVGPENSLPNRAATPWVLLACFSSLCYAGENIYLARWQIPDIGPIRLACGMNLTAAIMLAPLAVGFDQFFWPVFPLGILEWSVVGLACITAIAYTLYVVAVQNSGPVFASQVGYLVTIFGVFWGIAIFGETHSGWVWLSLILMLIGLALVSPRKAQPKSGTPSNSSSGKPQKT